MYWHMDMRYTHTHTDIYISGEEFFVQAIQINLLICKFDIIMIFFHNHLYFACGHLTQPINSFLVDNMVKERVKIKWFIIHIAW